MFLRRYIKRGNEFNSQCTSPPLTPSYANKQAFNLQALSNNQFIGWNSRDVIVWKIEDQKLNTIKTFFDQSFSFKPSNPFKKLENTSLIISIYSGKTISLTNLFNLDTGQVTSFTNNTIPTIYDPELTPINISKLGEIQFLLSNKSVSSFKLIQQ